MTQWASTRLLLVGAFLLAASAALAQSTLLQGGPWAAGHIPTYTGQPFGQTIVIDGGTAGGGDVGTGVSEIGITARGLGPPPYAASGGGPNGETFCSYDAPTTNPTGYHYLCLSPNAEGGGLLSYGAAGTAAILPFKINVNGADQAFSFTPSTAPAHQFANALTSAGGLTYAQPAFSDLSGVLGAGQFPASTAPMHQFATGINTSGGLVFAQPAFSDLSGSASIGQMPIVGAYQTLANPTTASAVVAPAPYVPVLNPMSAPYNAKGDGATDDTAAWKAVCAAAQAAGSGSIVSPAGKSYLVYSVQSVLIANAPMCGFSGLTAGVSVVMNGSTFQVGHTFPSRSGTAVLGTSAGAGGTCSLLVASNAGYQNGDSVTVTGIVGSTECNGTFTAVVDSNNATHIGLAGTTWANPWSSAGLVVDNSATLTLFSFTDSKYVVTDGIVFNQIYTEPASDAVKSFTGTIGIYLAGGGGPYRIYNSEGTGGQQPVKCSGLHTDSLTASIHDVQVVNLRSTNEIYGFTTSSNCSDLFARGIYTSGVARSFFTYGAQNQDVWLASINEIGEDVLIASDFNTVTVSGAVSGAGSKCRLTVNSTVGYNTGDTVDVEGIVGATACNGNGQTITINSPSSLTTSNAFGSAYVSGGTVVDTTSLRPTENISLNYSVLRRTSGSGTGQLVFDVGNQGQTHGIVRNVRAVIDADMRGDTNGSEAVVFGKFTTAALSSVLSDITISGVIRGQTGVGYAVDLFTQGDQPWSSESVKNINVVNLRIVGGTQGWYTDFAPFSTTIPGGLTTSNVTCDCAFTQVNATNILTQWAATSTYFTNLEPPFTAASINVNGGPAGYALSVSGTSDFTGTMTGAAANFSAAVSALNFASNGVEVLVNLATYTSLLSDSTQLVLGSTGDGYFNVSDFLIRGQDQTTKFAEFTSNGIVAWPATAAVSTSTGALIDKGGAGIAGALYVGGLGNFAGTLTAAAGGNVPVLTAANTFTASPQVTNVNQNTITYNQIANANASTTASAEYQFYNGTVAPRFGVTGTGFSTYQNLVANAGFWYTSSTAGLALDVDAAGPITLRVNNKTSTFASTGDWSFPGGLTLTTALAGASGGTGLSTAAIGDIIYASATTPTWARLADVATGSVLVSGGLNTAPAWSSTIPATAQGNITQTGTLTGGATGAGFTVALTTSTVTGILTAPNGGTGVASPTAHSLVMAEGASAVHLLTAATAGQIPIDQGSGSDFALEPISGDFTLSAGGVATAGGNAALLNASNTFTGALQSLTLSVNSVPAFAVTNNNGGTAARSEFAASNGTSTGRFGVAGTAYSGFANIVANAAYMLQTNAAGIAIAASAGPISLDANGNTATLASTGTWTVPVADISLGYAEQTGTSGPTLANGTAAQFASATLGAIYTGQGSTDDWVLRNKTPATVLANPTGTTNMVAAGTLTGLTGLTSSGTITFSGVTTGTNADFVCMAAGGILTLQTSACTISSRRFKQDIVAFDGGLNEVLRLRPVTFAMRPMEEIIDGVTRRNWLNPDSNFLKPQIGLIAEDVAKIDRRAAIYEDDGVTPKSYRQEAIIAMLVGAVQAQERRIEDLEHRSARQR